jgi:hypothetical protein
MRVAHRPGFTPGTGGSSLLDRIQERLPLRESILFDLSSHGVGIPAVGTSYAASGA